VVLFQALGVHLNVLELTIIVTNLLRKLIWNGLVARLCAQIRS